MPNLSAQHLADLYFVQHRYTFGSRIDLPSFIVQCDTAEQADTFTEMVYRDLGGTLRKPGQVGAYHMRHLILDSGLQFTFMCQVPETETAQ